MGIQEMAVGLLVDFAFSLGVFCELQSAITHIFYLGKSKNAVKKLRKQYSCWDRLRLRHVKAGKGECHKRALNAFLQLRKIYMGILCLTALIHLLSLGQVLSAEIWDSYLKIKWCAVDAVALVYFFVMTKHDKKHGGCTWRWE